MYAAAAIEEVSPHGYTLSVWFAGILARSKAHV
jgi:hypothetical protein